MAYVEKRGNGYRIVANEGFDADGKRIRRQKTWVPAPGMTAAQIRKEVERQRILFEEECKNGCVINRAIKFQDFAEKWFDEYAQSHLRATTMSTYRLLTHRTYAAIGHIRLDQINASTLNKFYLELQGLYVSKSARMIALPELKVLMSSRGMTAAQLAEKTALSPSTIKRVVGCKSVVYSTAAKVSDALGAPLETLFRREDSQAVKLAAKTVRHYHAFISSVLERAVKWGYLTENPCKRVDPPKLERRSIKCLNKEEARRFLQCLAGENVEKQAIFYTLLFTGVRRGELLGLEWTDVDFEEKTLIIQRSSLYTQAKGVFTDTTKNESSQRTISISPELIEVLRRHKAEQDNMRCQLGDAWIHSNRLFVEWNGAPMSPNKPYNILRRLLAKYKLPAVSLHSLRHTNATLMIAAGTDIKTTASRLGHSQTSTTMNIYVHQLRSSNELAADNLSKMLTVT